MLYGRGTKSIAEQLNCTKEKAQEIKDSVFNAFPCIKKFEEASLKMAYEKGYVTTVAGRKRRLPDYSLPEFEFEYLDKKYINDDPLDFSTEISLDVPYSIQNEYLRKLRTCRFEDKFGIINEARQKGILIIDNSKKIADAKRQCVNARVQGRRSTNCPYSFNPITQGCA